MNDVAVDLEIIQNHRLQLLIELNLASKRDLAAIRPFRCSQRVYLIDTETGRAAWGWSEGPTNAELLSMADAVGFAPEDVLEFWVLEDDRVAVFGEIVGEEPVVATHYPEPDGIPK